MTEQQLKEKWREQYLKSLDELYPPIASRWPNPFAKWARDRMRKRLIAQFDEHQFEVWGS